MTVTKQQQLEWLVNKIVKWPADGAKIPVSIDDAGNPKFYMPWDAFAPWDVMRVDFTRQEWQQERDKMQKQPAQPAQDNSWHERGEFPPSGTLCDIRVAPNDWIDKVEIVHSKTGQGVVVKLMPSTDVETYLSAVSHKLEFRPIRTEREKAIEDMSRLMHEHDSVINDITLGALYDAGYRKVKP